MCQDYGGKCTWDTGYLTCNDECKKCFNKACPFCGRKLNTNVRPETKKQKTTNNEHTKNQIGIETNGAERKSEMAWTVTLLGDTVGFT